MSLKPLYQVIIRFMPSEERTFFDVVELWLFEGAGI